MFVQDFQVVDRTYDEVQARLGDDVAGLLGRALDSARAEGENLRARVGPPSWPMLLAKTVEISPGPLRVHADRVLMAFSWEASGTSSLFPQLDADLEAAPLGADRTQLALRARYEVPGGLLGRGVDHLLLHRVAESTIRAFLNQICEALEGRTGRTPGRGRA
jgi:hypothetical protein